VTVLEIFFLAGDLEQRAPPELKEDMNRLLSAIAVWLDDLDNAPAKDEGPLADFEKSYELENFAAFQCRDWMTVDELYKQKAAGTYEPMTQALYDELVVQWPELMDKP
jgi:hypothetical protein